MHASRSTRAATALDHAPADERELMARLDEIAAEMASAPVGLGLELGRVAVVDHNQRWSGLYAELVPELRVALGGLPAAIEHVGSTAVADLVAKPILDVAVGLAEPADLWAATDALTAAGFRFNGDLGDYGGLFLLLEARPGLAVANMHVVAVDGPQWCRYLAFRDGLRSSHALRRHYGRLKVEMAERYANDRDGYTRAKSRWVRRTVRELDCATNRDHRR